MLKRFAFVVLFAVASMSLGGVFAACSSSSSSATPTGSCATLAVCCLGFSGVNQTICNTFATSGSATTCTTELASYSANGQCGGSPLGTGTGSGTGGFSTSCASLAACCAEMTAPAACDQVVTAGNQVSCASTLQVDEASGLCKAPMGSGSGSGTGSGSGSGTGACVAGGGTCTTFSDCCSGTCAQQVCNACSGSGASCTDGTGCCTGLTCYNGSCGSCSGDGTTCTLASDCCSNICNAGSCQTCAQAGSTCATATDCCSGSSCTGGTCCNAAGGTCTSSGDCCGGLACNDGACSLLAPGATCTTASQCSGGLPCTTWSPDGSTNVEQCCILVGGPGSCSTSADCCGVSEGDSVTCGGGVCQVPDGYECTAASQCAGGLPCTTDGPIMVCGDASGTACTSAATCLIGTCTSDRCCSAASGACLTALDCCTSGATCTGATSTTAGTCSE